MSGYFMVSALLVFWEVRAIKENRINEEIRDKELRVIDEDGNMLGIKTREEALDLAEERNLDLVLISPNADPPVCKILDYGKFRYESQKREKDAKKKQKTIQVKEIRLGTFIEEHDIQVKANTANKFLKDGDKVKVSLRFRGRELGHTDLGKEVMNKFADLCSEYSSIEKNPVMEGRVLTMFLSPKSEKDREKAAKEKAKEEAANQNQMAVELDPEE